MERDDDKRFIEARSNSQDYKRAFTKTTGLPLSLRPVELWPTPDAGKKSARAPQIKLAVCLQP